MILIRKFAIKSFEGAPQRGGEEWHRPTLELLASRPAEGGAAVAKHRRTELAGGSTLLPGGAGFY